MYIFNSVPYSYQQVNDHWQSVLDSRFILFWGDFRSILFVTSFWLWGNWRDLLLDFLSFYDNENYCFVCFFQKQHNLILYFLTSSSFIYCKLYYSSKTKIVHVCSYSNMCTLFLIGIGASVYTSIPKTERLLVPWVSCMHILFRSKEDTAPSLLIFCFLTCLLSLIQHLVKLLLK